MFRVNVAAAVKTLSSTSSAFGSASNSAAIDEKLQRQLLQEEEQAMARYKDQAAKTGTTNPFAAAAPAPGAAPAAADATPNILDLFGMSGGGGGGGGGAAEQVRILPLE